VRFTSASVILSALNRCLQKLKKHENVSQIYKGLSMSDLDQIAKKIDEALAAFTGNAHEPPEGSGVEHGDDSISMTKDGFITGVIRLQRLRDWVEGLAESGRIYREGATMERSSSLKVLGIEYPAAFFRSVRDCPIGTVIEVRLRSEMDIEFTKKPEVCGDRNPMGPTCVLAKGHSGPHDDGKSVSWFSGISETTGSGCRAPNVVLCDEPHPDDVLVRCMMPLEHLGAHINAGTVWPSERKRADPPGK
jgi:hypothetical protein